VCSKLYNPGQVSSESYDELPVRLIGFHQCDLALGVRLSAAASLLVRSEPVLFKWKDCLGPTRTMGEPPLLLGFQRISFWESFC
jgi:hypothetical protein